MIGPSRCAVWETTAAHTGGSTFLSLSYTAVSEVGSVSSTARYAALTAGCTRHTTKAIKSTSDENRSFFV